MSRIPFFPGRHGSSVGERAAGYGSVVRLFMGLMLGLLSWSVASTATQAATLQAGAARVEITDRTVPVVNDPLYAKALVLKSEKTVVVIITLDVVSMGEIGRIGNGFLATVRGELKRELGIAPESVIINASHCHGVPRPDTAALTVQAVKEAWQKMAPAHVAAGRGSEQRISENRRIKMKDGSEVDMRRAYPLPRDEDVKAVGPIDPEIGILRVDHADGKAMAVVYNFACHPIMNPPSTGNSADYPGFASKVIEEELGNGAVALFVQGCGGDINPIGYKGVAHPPQAEPLGTMLGLSVMRAVREMKTRADESLGIASTTLALPRAADFERRIAANEAEQVKLTRSLRGTNLNFKSFLPLLMQHRLFPEQPAAHAQQYLRQKDGGREDYTRLDADNRASIEAYLHNIEVMEKLTRLNANLALLKKHQAQTVAAGNTTLDVEMASVRVGEFRLVTFPGEVTVEVGLNIKKAAPHPHCFVAGYTNGYIYYTPTVAQRNNTGYAQEDCDTLVAPEWQALFEKRALEMLKGL
ncbi:hypothetical protein DES53_108177 [Roseimicrobium gellanilyticum]|uniref:Neutral/alkaline ceramidase-like enzyme n=1 Tax=Roseimicrobium gellanilyticum TaxID=748857 RepID=A0A366HEJ2_9BACT|nr:hypothetical protein [Roseimicrobium gellanilyticum]RBP40470.1 hypothetical protein DES53_108177 [Roseimicrobium gellanilyticum]